MVERRRVLVALLVPPPVQMEIDGLRRAVGSSEIERIAPHLTLVAPRNLPRARSLELHGHLQEVASRHSPMLLRLGPPDSFSPRPVLYLAVTHPELAALARDLDAGPLARPVGRAEREFVPHVTLLSGTDASRVAAALPVLARYEREVLIESFVLLEQDMTDSARPWRAVEEFRFGRPALTGRGGRELTFHLSRRLPPIELRDPLDRDRSPARADHLDCVVEERGCVLGQLQAVVSSSALLIEWIEILEEARATGVGGQLLSFAERVAAERGLEEVAVIDLRTPGFLSARGYRPGAFGCYMRRLSRPAG